MGCNSCAENGNGKTGHSLCCNALYRHSKGRDDDDGGDANSLGYCTDVNGGCSVAEGVCYPGLTCVDTTCVDDPIAYAAAVAAAVAAAADAAEAALVTRSSTGTITKGGPSFVLVVVGLLGAAMMTMTIVQHRRRGLLHRHHYSEVDATPIAV